MTNVFRSIGRKANDDGIIERTLNATDLRSILI